MLGLWTDARQLTVRVNSVQAADSFVNGVKLRGASLCYFAFPHAPYRLLRTQFVHETRFEPNQMVPLPSNTCLAHHRRCCTGARLPSLAHVVEGPFYMFVLRARLSIVPANVAELHDAAAAAQLFVSRGGLRQANTFCPFPMRASGAGSAQSAFRSCSAGKKHRG